MLKLAQLARDAFRSPNAASAAATRAAPRSDLARAAEQSIPLCWAAAGRDQDYLNLGDALSPVMVAAVAGKPVRHAAARSAAPRMSAVGTIGHGLQNGQIWVWGTGSSAWRNPLAKDGGREAYVTPPDTKLHVSATRGPISWRLLAGEEPAAHAVFGDPVWLLPRYFQPPPGKTAELGAILHLAELADRATDVHPKPELKRYVVPPALDGKVRLLNTVTDISAAALRRRLEDILACKRIVSTSLHGLVFAESYGIPCLYFTALPGRAGLRHIRLGPDDKLNLRMSDLYAGLGEKVIPVYNQPKGEATDWADVIAAIDRSWRPKQLDEARLLDAFPLPRAALPPAPGGLFEHPFVTSIPFQHDTRARVPA
jgi:hypothetical protein